MLLAFPQEFRFLEEKIEKLKSICQEVGLSSKVRELNKLSERLKSPFLIAVFGEVNAGKSSFLNALLGIPDLCRTDVDICTDRITVVKYCENPQRKEIDSLTEEVCIDNPLLKGFTVVDTPGINSVIEHHTYITEQFLPKSDVILVVLPAHNPHTKPVWDWISKIAKDFGKKVVFILQQKDLIPEKDVPRIVNKVKTYAQERGIEDPKVFAVSALKELEGEKEKSGFKELREFLAENYTGQKQVKVKLLNLKGELLKFAQKCLNEIEKLQKEGQTLKEKLEEVLNLLDRKLQEANRYKIALFETVDMWVNTLADKIAEKIEGLSVLDLAFRKERVRDFLKSLEVEIEESLERFTKYTLVPKLELFEEGVLKPAVEEAAKRLREFERYYKKLGKKALPLKGQDKVLKAFNSSIGHFEVGGGQEAVAVMGGSLLAGSLLMLLGGSFVVDLTGGVIASLGVLLGVGWILRKRSQLLKELKKILKAQVGEKLKKELNRMVENRLEETLLPMKSYVESRLKTVEETLNNLKRAKDEIITLIRDIKNFSP